MKNQSHKNKTSEDRSKLQEQPKKMTQEEIFQATANKANAEASKKKERQGGKDAEVIYRVLTMRDSKLLLAFITFNYRVFHPNITGRLLFYGILLLAPAFLVKPEWAKLIFITLGGLLLILAFFRQYLSLFLTKSTDYDYKARTEFSYDFTPNDMSFYRDDTLSAYSKYRDITGFYYDDDFYYLIFKNHEFHILPKAKFVLGSAADFEGFIYKKSHKTCKWIPTKFKDKMAKRRAARNLK